MILFIFFFLSFFRARLETSDVAVICLCMLIYYEDMNVSERVMSLCLFVCCLFGWICALANYYSGYLFPLFIALAIHVLHSFIVGLISLR